MHALDVAGKETVEKSAGDLCVGDGGGDAGIFS